MIKRSPPSPEITRKMYGYFFEVVYYENPFYILNPRTKYTNQQITEIIQRLESRSLDPNVRYPVRGTPLISAALKLPHEFGAQLVCKILQLGGDPMIPIKTLEPDNPAYCLHGILLRPEIYYKPLVQLIISYGFDRNVFQSMVDTITKTGAIERLPKDSVNIDEAYFIVSNLVKDAKSAMENNELEEAANHFFKAEKLFIQLAEKEENAHIGADYNLRATHCQEKIAECNDVLCIETPVMGLIR